MARFAGSLILLALAALASGCSESVPAPATVVADAAGALDTSADTSGDSSADGSAEFDADAGQAAEVDAQADAVADTAADGVADATADNVAACPYTCALDCVCKKDHKGCDVAECEAGDCAAILSKIDKLKPKLQACAAATGCEEFEYPICGSAGCFQMPVGKGADLSELNNLAGAAQAAKCSQFTCGCGPASPSYCLGGSCRQCPPDCDAGTCDDKAAAIAQFVGASRWCASDKDCIVHATGLCPFAGMPCGGVALSQYAKVSQLDALLSATAVPCNVAMCKCAVPGPASCVAGKCTVQ
jgi:hypothetical protein